ncbi:hypothetical protein SK128_009583 [Halocaridina rubra]|uniref:Uncharacterized protein n=1 Tax=Halocaridina rubra TaxID=373956 RepID=A0AAN9A5Y9_HALRR
MTRILVLLTIVVAVSALPRKPTVDFPKKYDAAIDGLKDTYGTYDRTPDEDLVVPADNIFLDTLIPPSSYDAYFEKQPQDPILPPDLSSYADVAPDAEGEPMLPPPEDTYSVHPGKGHLAFVPPPTREVLETYLSYDGEGQESLAAPPISSYAESPEDQSGANVLASMAAMVQSLPQPSSYHTYEPNASQVNVLAGAPSLVLSPPNAQEEPDSYSVLGEDQPPLTPEQIKALEEKGIPIPQLYLVPPS